MKTLTLEQIQDIRDAPKPQHKPIDAWDQTDLRRAMLADAKKMKFDTSRRVPKNVSKNQVQNHERRTYRVIQAVRAFGRPCTRIEIAEALGITPHCAHDYVRPLVIGNILTTDRNECQTIVYSLTESQKLLDI